MHDRRKEGVTRLAVLELDNDRAEVITNGIVGVLDDF